MNLVEKQSILHNIYRKIHKTILTKTNYYKYDIVDLMKKRNQMVDSMLLSIVNSFISAIAACVLFYLEYNISAIIIMFTTIIFLLDAFDSKNHIHYINTILNDKNFIYYGDMK